MNLVIPKPALILSHALVFTLLLISLLNSQATWQSDVTFSQAQPSLHALIRQLVSAN